MTTQNKLTEIPYYFINLAEKNQFFDRKNSLGVRCGIYSQNEPERFIAEPKDDEIIVTKQALETNVDMWFDPLLHHSLFISNKLVQKLFQVGFSKKDLGLVSCQVK